MEAFFFDRDGTIISDKHYLSNPKDIEFIPAALELLKLLTIKKIKTFIVTNQSGVGRGYFPISSIYQVHEEMNRQLKALGIDPFEDLVYCPHTPEDLCPCRKPSAKMIQQLMDKWNLNPEKCLMFGDKKSDYEAGLNAKVQSFQIIENPTEDYHIPSLEVFSKKIHSL